MLNRLFPALLLSFAAMFNAKEATAEEMERIYKDDDVVIYDGNLAGGEKLDVDVLRDLLITDNEISTIVLTGSFEGSPSALDVARMIEDFGLKTEIRDQCTDACLYMFVAGRERNLAKGAKIGVRRLMLDAATVREKFESRKARFGWEDEFGQAVMLYDVAQSDMRWALLYLMDHGVSLEFALRVFSTPREEMWWPERSDLTAGGVIAP